MTTAQPGSVSPLMLQILCLVVGIAIIVGSPSCGNKSRAVLASGIFFINIFWTTMVLEHDLRIWSWLRNSLPGNSVLLLIVASNLVVVAVLAIKGNVWEN